MRFNLVMGALAKIEHPNVRAAVMRLASEQFGREADARAVALRRAVIAARQRAQQAEIERDTALPLVNAARAVVEAKTAAAEHEAERGLINLAWTSYRGPDEDEA